MSYTTPIRLPALKKIIFYTALCLLASAFDAKAQNYIFSQNYSSPTLISPSFTGLIDKDRVSINYRDQWPKLKNTYVTYAMAYDHNFERLRSGMGISFLKDKAGAGNLGLTNVSLMYAYNVQLNREWSVRPGMSFMFSQRTINYSRLLFPDMINPDGSIADYSTEPFLNKEKLDYVDFNASVLAFSSKYWIGFTAENLLTPNQSFRGDTAKIPYRFIALGGTRIPIRQKSRRVQSKESISFTAIYRNRALLDQFDLGAYYTNEPFVIGLWARGFPIIASQDEYVNYLDAFIVLLGYRFNEFSIGYSFDFTISKLINDTGGAHEVSIVYQFRNNLKRNSRKKYVAVPCPGF